MAPSVVPAQSAGRVLVSGVKHHLHHRCDGLKGRRHWGCRTRWHRQPSNATGSSSGWAIPAAIVECESGFKNEAPNYAGASGYYQIKEWYDKGGRGAPYASEHSKAEQDAVAGRLYREQGTGPWVSSEGCWGGRV